MTVGTEGFSPRRSAARECGPTLTLYDKKQSISKNTDAVLMAKKGLEQGKIVAVKNTGGFLLLCDATDQCAVERLREIKKKKEALCYPCPRV
jgi:hydrogenase maturation protein HypF